MERLDLRAVAETQRPALWARTAHELFPGLTVRPSSGGALVGSLQGGPFASGALWTILSPAVFVRYLPVNPLGGRTEMFSVMLQLDGSITAAQGGRSCTLRPHEFCLIDGHVPFELEVTERSSRFMFLQIPRVAVLSRHPYLQHRTAQAFDPDEVGVSMLRRMLLELPESAPLLDEEQRGVVLIALAQLLGAPRMSRAPDSSDAGWRVRAALAYIDAQLSDPALSAPRVAQAQGISRRHLDELLLKSIGMSLTAQIWSRRLAQVATDLLDPRLVSRTVTHIAFSAGFKDMAHFTRAFKRRYDCTPREWRLRGPSQPASG